MPSYIVIWSSEPGRPVRNMFGPYATRANAQYDADLLADRIGGVATVHPMADPRVLTPIRRPRPLPRR